MSGETEAEPSAWTIDSLRFYFERLLAESDKRYEQRFISQQEAIQAALLAQKEAVNAALVAADRAVVKAETAAEKRFDNVNEFRGAMADQAATLMPRVEAESRLQAMAEKLADSTDRLNRSEGNRSGISASWAVAVAIAGMTLGVAGVILALLK